MSILIDSDLKKAAQQFVRNATFGGQIVGQLGKVESDGSITYEVPGRPNCVYVRILQGGTTTITTAINNAVGLNPVHVILDKNRDGNLYIVGLDNTKVTVAQGGASLPGLGVGPHSHRIGYGLEDLVEQRRFEPGLVARNTGLIVTIYPFTFRVDNIDYYYPGEDFDLTSYIPGTANYWAWVKVGVDPDDLTAYAITGTEYSVAAPLTADMLADVAFENYIPLVGVRLKNGQTSITQDSEFFDIRPFLTGIGGNTGSLVTQPNEITTDAIIPTGRNATFFGPITITGSLTMNGRAIIL
jgi:hypothetical protein